MTGNDGDGLWAAFEAEALPHVPRLFRVAMWLERNRPEAEDLVQETLTQALLSFHRYKPGTNCRAWLVTILHHLRSNRRRAGARLALVPDEGHQIAETVPFEPPVPDGLTDEEVLGALRTIPEVYQQLILLCDVEELTYKEAAEALSIPMGTVMSRLHRGRALLRTELAPALSSVMPAPVEPGGGPVTVLERHACVFQGRRFAHIVVRYRGRLASLLVPGDADAGKAVRPVLQVDGLSVVSFAASHHTVFVVSSLGDADARGLLRAFQEPVSRALAGV